VATLSSLYNLISQELFIMANQKHLEILKEGKETWNSWRKENPKIEPDLSGADLSRIFYGEIDFSGTNLEKADLSSAFLPNANFSFANLRYANLSRAFALSADFKGAILEGIDLSFANLSYSNLVKTNLSFAKLNHAKLEEANFYYADLSNAVLYRTNLTSASFKGASLKNAVLEEANLTSADFTDADLFRANLKYASLVNANLSSANLSEADLSNAYIHREIEGTKRSDKLIDNIKRHVVQVEVMVLMVVLFQAIISIQQPLQSLVSTDILFLFPFVFLAFIPIFIRVTNPESSLRSRLTFGLSGAGIGATIGGGITGTLTGGLGAPAGALIGAPIGFVIGAVAGPYIDGVNKKVLTQGEAREFLIGMRRKYPSLSLEKIIEATSTPYLRNNCAIYMFEVDGVIKCTKEDVIQWLKSECWK
jgi:uncharacterized protein YjbI with pentapeptide repeats